MREAKFKKSTTIVLSEATYQKIKAITDEKKISIAEWFREVTEKELNNVNEVNHDQ